MHRARLAPWFCLSLFAFAAACESSPTAPGLSSSATTASSSVTGSSASSTSTGSSSSAGSGGAADASSSSASSGATGGGGSGGAGGAGGQGGAGGGSEVVNGCAIKDAQDYTNVLFPLVKFPGSDTTHPVYNPACIKVKQGASVTFEGDFTMYPLRSGIVTPDSITSLKGGPFPDYPAESTGMAHDYTFPDAGVFGYYCPTHEDVMYGAVVVVASP